MDFSGCDLANRNGSESLCHTTQGSITTIERKLNAE